MKKLLSFPGTFLSPGIIGTKSADFVKLISNLLNFSKLKLLILPILFAGVMSSSFIAEANHIRHGTVSWQVVSGNTIEFKVSMAFAGYRSVGQPTMYSDRLFFGDGTFQNFSMTVTSSSQSENWHYGEAVITKTYNNPGNYLAYIQTCCKIVGMQNNNFDIFRVETLVNVGTGNSSPVVTMAPIIYMQEGQSQALFQIPAIDPDNDALSYRFATNSEYLGTNQPAGLSINPSTGLMTFNTNNTSAGHLHNAAIVVEDGQSKVVNDFIIKIVQQSNPPEFDYNVTPANGTVYTTTPGQPVTFDLLAFDTDSGSTVTLTTVGAPPGATFSPNIPVSGNPVQSQFSWTPSTNSIGTNVVNFFAQDNVGAQVSTSVSIIVSNCNVSASANDVTLTLNEDGEATLTASELDDNSSASCGIASMDVSQSLFTCSDIGANTVTLTVTDVNNNTSTANATVTVVDNTPPSIAGAGDHTMNLPNGHTNSWNPWTYSFADMVPAGATIVGVDMQFTAHDQGWGNTGGWATFQVAGTTIGSAQLFHSAMNYSLSYTGTLPNYNYGANNVLSMQFVGWPGWQSFMYNGVLTLHYNASGKTGQITAYLDANGNVVIDPSDIDPGFDDNCGIASTTLSQNTFNCSSLGANAVTLTVTDVNNNSTTFAGQVTVLDTNAPDVLTQDITVYLDASGNASVTAADIDNGTDAACGINTLSLDQTSFSCSNVGANTVTLTAESNSGNVSSGTATVTVVDPNMPNVLTQDITVYLDANGNASITTTGIDNGSNAVCGIGSLSLDQTSFTCSNVGANTVTLTAESNSGNVSTGTATVTVVDNIAPVVACEQNVTITLNGGVATLDANMLHSSASDACGIASFDLSKSSFDCSEIGNHNVTLTVTDVNGNATSCNVNVTVIGEVPAVSIASAPTSNVYTGGDDNALYLGYGAQSTVLTTTVSGGSNFTYMWTGVGLDDYTAANPEFTPVDEGTYSFTVTVTNEFGCSETASINICVLDVKVYKRNGTVHNNMVTICHVGNGNNPNSNTLKVNKNAVSSHLTNHNGDKLGACDQDCWSVANKKGNEVATSVLVDDAENVVFNVYPNPSHGAFRLEIEGHSSQPIDVRIYDILGREAGHYESSSDTRLMEVGADLTQGVYFIQVVQGNHTEVIQVQKY